MKCLCCNKELNEKDILWHKKCLKRFFGTLEIPNIDSSIEKEIENDLKNRKTITGVQEKFSYTLKELDQSANKITLNFGAEYLIKPNTNKYNNIAEAEFVTMTLAKEIMKVPLFGLIPYNDSYLYIIKRYDRINGKKVHVEDFAQLLGLPTENKYQGSYEQCAKKVILKYSDLPKLDLSDFFLRILFSYVTLNSDMHLKNFSLIEDEEIRLSPQYDLLPVKLFSNDSEDLALTLNGKKKKLNRNDFIKFGYNIGILKPEKLIDYLINYQDKFNKIIEESILSEEFKKKYILKMNEHFNLIKKN